jgi:hypothetical protein
MMAAYQLLRPAVGQQRWKVLIWTVKNNFNYNKLFSKMSEIFVLALIQ